MSDREIVLFLIDTNPIAWNKLESEFSVSFSSVMSQIYSYLMQMVLSDVFQLPPLLAYNQCGVKWLFPSPDQATALISGNLQATNTGEIVSYCRAINNCLSAFANECAEKEQKVNDVRLDVAISTALCHLNKYPSNYLKRIIVITPSNDSESCFESTMNSIFTAHRINVTIDSLLLNVKDSLFLNQAAILTGGFSLSIQKRLPYIFQYLLALPPLPIRGLIELKKVQARNYTAPAVNTKKLIDQGLMCPVCLSVYEKDDKPLNKCQVCNMNQQFLRK